MSRARQRQHKPRGLARVDYAVSWAHVQLANKVLGQCIPDWQRDNKLAVCYGNAGTQCPTCGFAMSAWLAPDWMNEPDIDCLNCHGFLPNILVSEEHDRPDPLPWGGWSVPMKPH